MNVLFIYLIPPKNEYQMGYTQGIGFLSTILKKNNHNTSLIRIDTLDKDEIGKSIQDFKPGLIALSCTSDQSYLAKDISKYIKENFNIPVILGGVHATVAPDDSITCEVNAICLGEGDHALLEFVETLEKGKDISKIKNFWIKKDGKIIKNPPRPLIQDLDSLGFPDRDMFDYKTLLKGYYNGLEFLAGRGCPYQCSYCINHVLQKLNKGSKFVRWRSVNNVLSEMKLVMPKYKGCYDIITFHDDTFTLDKNWFKEFAEKYSKEISFPFRCATRANFIDEEMVSLLKKANCKEVWIGVEAGDEDMRNKILSKRITDEQIIKAFKLCKDNGIKTTAFNMIGVPYETEETINKTIEINKKIKADNIMLSIFQPYPGTELGELCKKNGWLTEKRVGGVYKTTVLNQPDMPKKKLEYYRSIFHASVGESKLLPLIKLLAKIRVAKDYNLYEALRLATVKIVNDKQRNFLKKIVWGV